MKVKEGQDKKKETKKMEYKLVVVGAGGVGELFIYHNDALKSSTKSPIATCRYAEPFARVPLSFDSLN